MSANPFPGLRAFEADETHLFFGRDGQSAAIIAQLQRSRFVGVVGTSGSGKSSLVRAGLLPQLEGGFMASAGSSWRFAVLKPGDAPLRNLAQALAARGALGDGAADPSARRAQIEAVLQRGSLGLIDAVVQARLEPGDNLLVVVDQFEEIFRMARLGGAGSGDEADHFVALLLEAASQTATPIYVVLTMRSDFLGDCARFRGLPEALNRGQYLVPRMSRDERRAAIEGPVAVGGATIAARLVQQILNEVGDRPDQLPVMQHALMRTWDAWVADGRPDQPIDVRHYESIGGLSQALDQHANEALKSLTAPGQQQIAKLVFQRLCERATDYRETRRPTRLAELAAVAGVDLAAASAVIEPFRSQGRTFLMPLAPAVLDGDTVIDIAHEALIRQWGTLRRWADEEAESAAMYRRLAEDAALYAQRKVPLWRDPQLQLGRDWLRSHRPTAAWAARYDARFQDAIAFLEASTVARRRSRVALIALFGLLPLIAAAGWGIVELMGKNEKISQINEQLKVRNAAIERQSADLALANKRLGLAGDELSKRATRLEQQAAELKLARDEAVNQKSLAERRREDALRLEGQARASRLALLSLAAHDSDVQALLAVEALQAASGPEAEAAMWNALSRPTRLPLLAQEVGLAVATADWTQVLVQSGDGSLALWDVGQGRVIARAQPDARRADAQLALAPDGRRLFVAGPGDGIEMLEQQGGRWQPMPAPLQRPHAGAMLRALVVSPDGQRLATADNTGRVVLWAVDSGLQPLHVVQATGGAPASMAFDARGRWLALASAAGAVTVHDVASGADLTASTVAAGPPATAASAGATPPLSRARTAPRSVSPRLSWAGERLLVLKSGRLEMRRAPRFAEEIGTAQVRQNDTDVVSLLVGRLARHVYTVSADGVLATTLLRNQTMTPARSVRYADVVGGRPALPVSSRFGALAESADGDTIAFTAGDSGGNQDHVIIASASRFSAVSAVRLPRGTVRALGFSADGRMLVAVTSAGIQRYSLTDPLLALAPVKLASSEPVETLEPTRDGSVVGLDGEGTPFRRLPSLRPDASVPMLLVDDDAPDRIRGTDAVAAVAPGGAGLVMLQAVREAGLTRHLMRWEPADGPGQVVPIGPDALLPMKLLTAAAGQVAWVAGDGPQRRTIRLWSPRAPGVVQQVTVDSPVGSLALSGDGTRLAAVLEGGGARPAGDGPEADGRKGAVGLVWSLPLEGRAPVKLEWPELAAEEVRLQFAPGGQWLAAHLKSRALEIRPIDALGSANRPPLLTAARFAFLSDGRRVLTAHRDNGLEVHALDRLSAAPQRLTAGLLEVTALATSSQNRWLAAGLADGTVRVWDARSLAPKALLRGGQREAITALAFGGPDTLTAGDRAGAVLGWSLTRLPELPLPLAALCSQVHRNLPEQVWRSAMGQQPYRRTCPGVQVDPDVLKGLLREAWQAADRRDQPGVVRLVRRVLDESRDVSDPDQLNDLCYFMALAGRGGDALTLCERALAAVPNDGPMLDSRGVALALAGRLNEAARDIQAAVNSRSFPDRFKAQRNGWLEALRRGTNPIDESVLAAERNRLR